MESVFKCSNLAQIWILLVILVGKSEEKVLFDFGHYTEPLVTRTDNLTVLQNSDIIVQLRCSANYPTEWIFNDDTIYENNKLGRYRQEWTDRKFDENIEETEYKYIAWTHLQFPKMVEQDVWICRSVSNHSDSIVVKLTPSVNGTHVLITVHPNHADEDVEGGVSAGSGNSNSCTVQFSVVQLSTGYYWKCDTAEGNGGSGGGAGLRKIEFHGCPWSAAYCANTFRSLKKREGACLTVLDPATTFTTELGNWQRMENDNTQAPGVALCSTGSGDETERRAVEYFFSGVVVNSTSGPQRKLHFSWSEIQPVDMIWMSPTPEDNSYTSESLETSCVVPKYGFSFDPVLIIKLNGSRLGLGRDYKEIDEDRTWVSKVELQFSKFGSGHYEIQCLGPVWNSTEWANKTKSIMVKDPIAPHFTLPFENITYQDGEVNKRLRCDANGDPKPIISWDTGNVPSSRVEGSTFLIAKVTKLLTDQAFVRCIASNKFGQSASKSFLIHVTEVELVDQEREQQQPQPQPDSSSSSSTTTTIIIIAVVCIIVVLLLVGGLVFFLLYFKFLKLGTAIATYLTFEEVKEFREGKPKPKEGPGAGGECLPKNDYENAYGVVRPGDGGAAAAGDGDDDTSTAAGVLAIECLPYNSEFEVLKDNLIVDFNQELGSGEYGIVYHGNIKLNSKDKSPIPVAIKTVRKNVHINYFKALMSELKILAYIGHHEHVVNLIGAYTSNLKNRELFVGVELCKTSLLRFLQNNRNSFQSFVGDGDGDALVDETSFVSSSDYQNQAATFSNSTKTMTTFDLIKWSAEIASGMEFLSKKRVVHGDLATRNVLLSYELHAKICDFGLARQLIDYNYVKSQQCPLPWKWMAVESLSEMKFSTKSDVWAYGVTLWEIFSLGNVPYPGLAWNLDFVDQLNSGLRMSKPRYASGEIFGTMIECWRRNPKDRPKFNELKEFFQALEVK